MEAIQERCRYCTRRWGRGERKQSRTNPGVCRGCDIINDVMRRLGRRFGGA